MAEKEEDMVVMESLKRMKNKENKMKYTKGIKSLFKRSPTYIIFFVTAKCNSRCVMCFNWKNIDDCNKRKELTLNEIEKISKNLGQLQYLTLSGGEPSLRSDIVDICKIFDKNNKVQFITYATNGLLPYKIKEDVEGILQLKNPFLKVCLSLDGLFGLHDAIRGVYGNFNKVAETYTLLEMLKEKYNLEIQINMTVSYFNKNKVEEVYSYVKNNFKKAVFNICFARGNTRNKKSKDITIERYEEIRDFMKNIKKDEKQNYPFSSVIKNAKLLARDIAVETIKNKRRDYPCSAGKKMIIINEIGEVFPCETLWDKFSFGNLRENDYNIKKMLRSENGKKIIKHINDKKCYCTFENALQNSIIYSPSLYYRLLRRIKK